MEKRKIVAIVSQCNIYLENGFVTQSRLMTPDVMLTVLTGAAGFSWIVQLRKQERSICYKYIIRKSVMLIFIIREPFTVHWGWQTICGMFMGLALRYTTSVENCCRNVNLTREFY